METQNISLVINLTTSVAEPTAAGAHFLAPLLDKLELPATWIIDGSWQGKVFADWPLAARGHELALTASARSPQRLRRELANLQATVLAVSGQDVSVVSGDPQQLRSRAALLADLGIVAVVSELQPPGPPKPPRQLPYGLWQFDRTMTIPQLRHRWSWLTSRRPTLKQLFAAETSGNTKVVTIDLGQAKARELQECEQLLQEIAKGSCQRQIRVTTIGQRAAELASEHAAKPQRSILRLAA